VIPRAEFNHGATRELGRQLLGTDIVIMMTQDAVLESSTAIPTLVTRMRENEADIAYGRQLPKPGADIFEAWPREFNYPCNSHRRTLQDVGRHGVYTFFCSDSFAAYRQSSLDRVGGFEYVLTNEDYFTTARVLAAGGAIMYVADAAVFHSHRYTLWQEFTRYFDTGFVRGQRPWVQQLVGRAERRGANMVGGLIARLWRERPSQVPYALVQAAAKWIGFRLGYYSVHAPAWWNRSLSSQKYYWASNQNSESGRVVSCEISM
jgi:rhamnosyltransferase